MIPEFKKVLTVIILVVVIVAFVDVLFDINLITLLKSILQKIGLRS